MHSQISRKKITQGQITEGINCKHYELWQTPQERD